jgi:hypothetical protein
MASIAVEGFAHCIAAGGEVVAPSVEPTAEEMSFMDSAAADDLAEEIRLNDLNNLIALDAEEELLFDEENDDAQDSNSKDDDAASDTSEIEELSSCQEIAELEKDLAGEMIGGDDD